MSNRSLNPPALGVVVLGAIFWEFAEWASDRSLGTRAQLGLDDTLLDMLLGIVGGLAVVSLVGARPRQIRSETPGSRSAS